MIKYASILNAYNDLRKKCTFLKFDYSVDQNLEYEDLDKGYSYAITIKYKSKIFRGFEISSAIYIDDKFYNDSNRVSIKIDKPRLVIDNDISMLASDNLFYKFIQFSEEGIDGKDLINKCIKYFNDTHKNTIISELKKIK